MLITLREFGYISRHTGVMFDDHFVYSHNLCDTDEMDEMVIFVKRK